MRALRSIFEFVTGGSLVAPIGLACAILAVLAFPQWRAGAFVTIVVFTYAASTYEKPN